MALLKDREAQVKEREAKEHKKKEVLSLDPYDDLHRIDPYSIAEIADKTRPRVKQLPGTEPEIVSIKPVGKKDDDTEEIQLTIDVPIHQHTH